MDDAQHYERLREAKKRYLQELEYQAAQLGPTAPPHISIQIRDLQEELFYLESAAVGSSEFSNERELSELDRWRMRSRQLRTLRQYIGQESAVTREDIQSFRATAKTLVLLLIIWLSLLTLVILFRVG